MRLTPSTFAAWAALALAGLTAGPGQSQTVGAKNPPALAPPARPTEAPRLRLPASVRLEYEFSGRSHGLKYSASGAMTWQQDGRRYEANMVINAPLLLNLRTMNSVGDLGPQGLVPRRFADKARREKTTHFQPEQGRIVFGNNGTETPWKSGTQDRLSIFFQLAGMVAAHPGQQAPGTQIQVPTAGTGELDTWTFKVVGRPLLDLPAGKHATIALRRDAPRPQDPSIEVWFAPALGYVPARIRIVQGNGEVLDQRLSGVHPL